MNHGYFQDRLSGYFDQALTPEEMLMMKEHLASCAECREQLDDLGKLDKLIEAKAVLGESDYWENAAQKIEKRIAAEEDTKVTDVRSGWFGLGWKLAAAAASIAALTFVTLHEGEIQDTTVMQAESSSKISVTLQTDTVQGTALDEFDIEAETVQHEPLLESPVEQTAQKEKSPDMAKAPSPTIVQQEGKGRVRELTASSVSEDATEKLDLDESSVETVDELLESVSGVVTNSSGEIFVRGGRAGETDHIIDSVPAQDTEEVVVDLGTIALSKKQSDIGKTISVKGTRDIIDKFEVSNQATISREQLATTDDSRSLEYWRAVRDSLLLTTPYTAEKRGTTAKKSQESADDQLYQTSPSPSVADSIILPTQTPLERYLEACYKIAELTDRESEYDSVLVILTDHAENSDSPGQELARRYLDQLEQLQK
jgi:hypothetical protein